MFISNTFYLKRKTKKMKQIFIILIVLVLVVNQGLVNSRSDNPKKANDAIRSMYTAALTGNSTSRLIRLKDVFQIQQDSIKLGGGVTSVGNDNPASNLISSITGLIGRGNNSKPTGQEIGKTAGSVIQALGSLFSPNKNSKDNKSEPQITGLLNGVLGLFTGKNDTVKSDEKSKNASNVIGKIGDFFSGKKDPKDNSTGGINGKVLGNVFKSLGDLVSSGTNSKDNENDNAKTTNGSQTNSTKKEDQGKKAAKGFSDFVNVLGGLFGGGG